MKKSSSSMIFYDRPDDGVLAEAGEVGIKLIGFNLICSIPRDPGSPHRTSEDDERLGCTSSPKRNAWVL